MSPHNYHTEVYNFLNRLDDSDTISIIRDISSAISSNTGAWTEPLCSDSYEDLEVGIDFPDFYIEDFRLPLTEMKMALYQWLLSINPKSSEYLEEIEDFKYNSRRIHFLLKFKQINGPFGYQRKVCESLLKSYRPLCFLQFCNSIDCNYIIKHIDKAIISKGCDHRIFKDRRENISVEISSNWFKIGNLTDKACLGISLMSAKQLLQEWIEFLNNKTVSSSRF